MSDNSWYENGDLPPVGSKCIVDSIDCHGAYPRSFHDIEVDINFHMVYHSGDEIAVFSMVDPEDRDCLKFHGMVKGCFRPIKTERELAIEEMEKIMNSAPFSGYVNIAEKIYDAGYRKNES